MAELVILLAVMLAASVAYTFYQAGQFDRKARRLNAKQFDFLCAIDGDFGTVFSRLDKLRDKALDRDKILAHQELILWHLVQGHRIENMTIKQLNDEMNAAMAARQTAEHAVTGE